MQVVKGNSDQITTYPEVIDRSLILLIPHPLTGKLHKITAGELMDKVGSGQSEKVILNTPGSYTIPVNKLLEMIRVQSPIDFTLRIGTAMGLDDILPDIPVQANNTAPISLLLPADGANKEIFLSGFSHPINITFYKR